jgi:hypothetical protein
MNLSEGTLSVLKNFAQINPSLLFEPGSTLRTVSPQKTVLAKAKIAEKMPQQFAIYDLPQLLGVISMYEEYELAFSDTKMQIANGMKSTNFFFADPGAIISPPDKEVKVENAEIEFTLTDKVLQEIIKAAQIHGAPKIAIIGTDGIMSITAIDTDNPAANSTSIKLGETTATYQMIFAIENFKLLPREYKVSITAGGVSFFEAEDVEYFIAADRSSTYTG